MTYTRFNDGWTVGPKRSMMSAFGEPVAPPEKVTLPHDMMIHQKRGADVPSGKHKGYHADGSWEYVKEWAAPKADGTVYILEFEGVYMNAEVFVNGQFAAQRPYGYSGFYVPLNDFIMPGEKNVIRVTVETGKDCRWYSGAGIYRNVNLLSAPPEHFAADGVRITTECIHNDYAAITVESRIEARARFDGVVETVLYDPEGAPAAKDVCPVTALDGVTVVRQRMVVKKPRLWDTEHPALYTCVSTLSGKPKGEVSIHDTVENTFGIRVLGLDTARGLTLNGKTVKLRGACIHHDNGVLGAATFERAEYRRAERLRDAGFNALRSAHHPMSKAMLSACDSLGILVMDEAFDMWTLCKTDSDYSRYFPEWWERDVGAMVDKDYNHPCVVLYSIGNEIPDTGSPMGARWGRRIAEKIRSTDTTRFVINSVNLMLAVSDQMDTLMQSQEAQKKKASGDINQVMADFGLMMKALVNSDLVSEATAESFGAVDIAGYNYADNRYRDDGVRYPNRVICGSETFPRDIAANWALVEELPYVIGDFTWTGWDYLGEAGIGITHYGEGGALEGGFPWITAWCGDIDICGNRRPVSYWREIVWGLRCEPYITVLAPEHYGETAHPSPWAWSDSSPCWTWPGFEHKPVQVEVYSAADEAALFVNGIEKGRKPVGKAHAFKAVFDITYEPGTIEAAAFAGGRETGRVALRTAGGDVELAVKPERGTVHANCGDLAYVDISLIDKNGIVNPAVTKKLTVTVEGAGVLQGFGSANPVTEEPYTDNGHSTFEGRALAVVRPAHAGAVTVTVSGDDLAAKTVTITVKDVTD